MEAARGGAPAAAGEVERSLAREYVAQALRVLLGLVAVIFGVNGFLEFVPYPTLHGRAADLMTLLLSTGTLFGVYILCVLGGTLVLSNRRVVLGLLFLLPVHVGLVLFNTLLDSQLIVAALACAALWLGVAWSYRDTFKTVVS